jgi:hypothetical protein
MAIIYGYSASKSITVFFFFQQFFFIPAIGSSLTNSLIENRESMLDTTHIGDGEEKDAGKRIRNSAFMFTFLSVCGA